MTVKKDPSEYSRKYQTFRHHAWAGLGFLSVLLAIGIIFQDLLDYLSPILLILIIYIVVALLFTYKYRSGLAAKQEVVHPSEEIEKEKIHAEVEKERLKLEKKKTKAETKSKKKENKK